MDRAFEQSIQTFIKTGQEELKFDTMFPIRKLEKTLKEIGFEDLELDGDETNGWQIDFWYKFKSKKYGNYILDGSLHYGNFKLSKE